MVRIQAFPRGLSAVALAMVAASCAGRSVSESDGTGSGGDAGSGGKATSTGGTSVTGGAGGSVPGSGGTGGSPGSGGAAQGGGTTTGGSGGKGGGGGSLGKGATGGTGLGGGAPTAGTGGGTAGSVAIGGSGGTPSTGACLQPIDHGMCDAYILSWGFDVATGQCVEFVYGGCSESENNFRTQAECVARCEPSSEATACMSPGDCALVDPVCCRCDPALSDLLAVNRVYVNDILAPCQLVDCDACVNPPFSPWFTSLCEAGQCVAVDARQHELTQCSVDTDCRLRMGLGCCDCGSEVVAVNVYVSVESLVCPEGGCAADCAPQYPSDATPFCNVDGRCDVLLREGSRFTGS